VPCGPAGRTASFVFWFQTIYTVGHPVASLWRAIELFLFDLFRMTADSISNCVLVLIVCALVWFFWRAAQPPRLFTVRVVDGTPKATEGTVTPAFLERVREVASANEILRGTVSGYAYGSFIRLKFSAEFSEECRQQLRNWWAAFGWAAPRPGLPRRCG
jgi:hypothetical protein